MDYSFHGVSPFAHRRNQLCNHSTTVPASRKSRSFRWSISVGEPIPDHSRDGRQLIFPSYDGVYSADDHQAFGSSPWGYCGLFLADLVPAAGNDDKAAPNAPAGLNGVFDRSSGAVRLRWARCTDNVGVDAYNVYRDGRKIAATGFIEYTDTIKGAVAASYRCQIGAKRRGVMHRLPQAVAHARRKRGQEVSFTETCGNGPREETPICQR